MKLYACGYVDEFVIYTRMYKFHASYIRTIVFLDNVHYNVPLCDDSTCEKCHITFNISSIVLILTLNTIFFSLYSLDPFFHFIRSLI